MREQVDTFESDGVNTVFKTIEKYTEGSLSVKLIKTDQTEELVNFVELGEQYVQLLSTPLIGEKIVLTYQLFSKSDMSKEEEYELRERIVKLEKAIEDLYILNKANQEALKHRVNITAFQSWLRLVEKKTGIKLIDGPLGLIDRELYK